jgi:FkbM family methyltransferase
MTFGPSILLRGVISADAAGVNQYPAWNDQFTPYDLNKHAQMTRIRSAYESMLRAGRNPVIINAGANIGASSIWFSKHFPEAKLFAVEQDPQNAELCRRNCESLKNVTVVEAAIGSAPGSVKLKRHDNDKNSWAVQTERGEGADIPVISVDKLLTEAGLDDQLFIIKIGIEGFERGPIFFRDIMVVGGHSLSLLNYMIDVAGSV